MVGGACLLAVVTGFRSVIPMRAASSRLVTMRAESETTRRSAIRRVVQTGGAAAAAALGAAVPWADAVVEIDPNSVKTTKGGCKFVVVKEGSCPAADPTGLAGSCYVGRASFIILDYTAFLPNGSVFDTTEKKDGKPLAFKMGQKQVIPGIEEVVAYMLPGEEVQALIPAALACKWNLASPHLSHGVRSRHVASRVMSR